MGKLCSFRGLLDQTLVCQATENVREPSDIPASRIISRTEDTAKALWIARDPLTRDAVRRSKKFYKPVGLFLRSGQILIRPNRREPRCGAAAPDFWTAR